MKELLELVGTAIGKNPIAIVIPCHRVIGSDGSMTGYVYGVDRKKMLLDLEKGYNREEYKKNRLF